MCQPGTPWRHPDNAGGPTVSLLGTPEPNPALQETRGETASLEPWCRGGEAVPQSSRNRRLGLQAPRQAPEGRRAGGAQMCESS